MNWRNKDSLEEDEEGKPQEEVLHVEELTLVDDGLSIEELKTLKIGEAIKTWYATHSKWFTTKLGTCSQSFKMQC